MAIDVPTTIYKKKKENKGLSKNDVAKLQAQWQDRQRLKKEGKRKTLDLNEFLGQK